MASKTVDQHAARVEIPPSPPSFDADRAQQHLLRDDSHLREHGDFMLPRMSQARAVIQVAQRSFGGEYPSAERPAFEYVFNSIVFAARLLDECRSRMGSTAVAALPRYGEWVAFVDEAVSMLRMLESLVWSDSVEQTISDDLTCDFLGAVDGAIGRGLAALEGIDKEASHV